MDNTTPDWNVVGSWLATNANVFTDAGGVVVRDGDADALLKNLSDQREQEVDLESRQRAFYGYERAHDALQSYKNGMNVHIATLNGDVVGAMSTRQLDGNYEIWNTGSIQKVRGVGSALVIDVCRVAAENNLTVVGTPSLGVESFWDTLTNGLDMGGPDGAVIVLSHVD